MQISPQCWAVLGVVILLLQLPARAATKDDWLPIPAAELAETAPKLLPDAAAEVIFLKIEMDDRDLPEERIRREYLRAKIYKPEHIEALTRISGREVSDDSYFGTENKVKLSARLTLPDGTTKVFGDEAIRERSLAHSGETSLLERMLGATGQQIKERFIAVGGAEAGAILEYKIERREHGLFYRPYDVTTFQRRGMAIRHAEILVFPPNGVDWNYRYFVINPAVAHAVMQEDPKRKILTLEASDVPPMADEPLAGSNAYHALCLMSCYEKKERKYIPRHHPTGYTIDPAKTGAWSLYSITDFKTQQDYFETTPRIRKLTEETVSGVTDPAEKAKLIHQRVAALYAQFSKESKFNKTEPRLEAYSRTLDDLLDYNRKTDVFGIGSLDFMVLSMAMYKVAGIESRMILLPDRRIAPLNRKLASRVLLPHRALQVKLGDQWVYSMPTIQPLLPLGDIPWYCEGQLALLVKDGPEEFIPVGYSESSKSLIANGGTFELKADGSLTGTAKRKYTGNAAFGLRQRLLNRDPSRQRAIVARQISREFKVVLRRSKDMDDEGSETDPDRSSGAVAIKSIVGLGTPELPIEITYTLTLPHFAEASDQHLIFRPWLFRADAPSPFSSDTRTTNVNFPYAVQELDLITFKLPSGYKPEFSEETAPSSGQALHYKTSISFSPESGILKLRREFASNIVTVPVAAYPDLKSWYDTMARTDQQQVIATATTATAVELPAAPLVQPPSAGADSSRPKNPEADPASPEPAGKT